jgi:hypothetical protein
VGVRHRTDGETRHPQHYFTNQEITMTFVRTTVSIAVLSSAAMFTSSWAAADKQHDAHHPAPTTVTQVAQAQPAATSMGMRAGATPPGYADQMKAMQQMHDKMMAAKTPEERTALMAEQMKLMQGSMNMMGGMGGMGGMGAGAAAGKPADMAARQGMMEQRMDMMQSMMQMMMDRMPPVPATK